MVRRCSSSSQTPHSNLPTFETLEDRLLLHAPILSLEGRLGGAVHGERAILQSPRIAPVFRDSGISGMHAAMPRREALHAQARRHMEIAPPSSMPQGLRESSSVVILVPLRSLFVGTTLNGSPQGPLPASENPSSRRTGETVAFREVAPASASARVSAEETIGPLAPRSNDSDLLEAVAGQDSPADSPVVPNANTVRVELPPAGLPRSLATAPSSGWFSFRTRSDMARGDAFVFEAERPIAEPSGRPIGERREPPSEERLSQSVPSISAWGLPLAASLLTEATVVGLGAAECAVQAWSNLPHENQESGDGGWVWVGVTSWLLAAAIACEASRRRNRQQRMEDLVFADGLEAHS